MSPSPDKIMIIDDDRALLFGLEAMLSQYGYDVIACNESQKSVKVAEEEMPDLIVSDVMMPVMNGFDVQQKLSENTATANIPFIFLSARTHQTDRLNGLESGADDYITKPFNPRELVARIKATLNRQEKGRQTGQAEMNAKMNEIRTEILRNVSHELRTPLTQILLSLEMAMVGKSQNPDELDWLMETAFMQSNKLNSIINDMIYLSSFESDQANTIRQDVDVLSSFLEPLKILRDSYKDKGMKIDILANPSVSVHAPRREFKQATMHLIDNALKFSPPMTSVRVELEENGVGGFILEVSDYGNGIPQELREKVFERFYQIDSGDTRSYNGLGVGLTIARLFARSLGGEVEILDTNSGCTVRMTIPPAPISTS